MEQVYERCKSCKYLNEHYIILGTYLSPIDGHCLNENVNTPRKRGIFHLLENCPYWENNTEKIEKRIQCVKSILGNMREHLEQIEMILVRLDKDVNE